MNKFSIIGIIGLLLLLTTLINNSVNAKEFINEEYGIKFEYPDEWKLMKNEKPSFEIEYDRKPIVIFYPNPDPTIVLNFFALTVYTNMANLDQFEKTIRKELLTDEKVKHDILNIKKYNLKNSGVPIVYINTLYTPILTGAMAQFAAPSDARNYILFQKDGIGYEIEYTLPPELNKYHTNVISIANQIMDNMASP